MKLWKKLLGLIVGVVSMTIMPVSSVEQDIVNEDEFKTLCEFVGLTERINELLRGMEGNSGVSVSSLQKKVTDILYGTGVSAVNEMRWNRHREMDCGQDNRVKPASAGRALVQDIICLCDGRDQKPSKKDLCYKESGEHRRYTYWWDSQGHGNTWSHLRNGCKTERGGSAPKEAVFKELKRQLQAGLKTYPGGNESAYYTYGGHTNSGLQTCNGFTTSTDGICVMYQRGSDQDSTIGIKWLNNLEDLVKKVEEMRKLQARAQSQPQPQRQTRTQIHGRSQTQSQARREVHQPSDQTNRKKMETQIRKQLSVLRQVPLRQDHRKNKRVPPKLFYSPYGYFSFYRLYKLIHHSTFK
uniref:Variant surface glycoprotein 1595 n=1 Tax=Trypanosoma brucei TaxID=5691 RepID=M4SYU2_9TRYP|nr:variant surface glycoprotein 1595 [Trypanosoma brucei]